MTTLIVFTRGCNAATVNQPKIYGYCRVQVMAHIYWALGEDKEPTFSRLGLN